MSRPHGRADDVLREQAFGFQDPVPGARQGWPVVMLRENQRVTFDGAVAILCCADKSGRGDRIRVVLRAVLTNTGEWQCW